MKFQFRLTHLFWTISIIAVSIAVMPALDRWVFPGCGYTIYDSALRDYKCLCLGDAIEKVDTIVQHYPYDVDRPKAEVLRKLIAAQLLLNKSQPGAEKLVAEAAAAPAARHLADEIASLKKQLANRENATAAAHETTNAVR